MGNLKDYLAESTGFMGVEHCVQCGELTNGEKLWMASSQDERVPSCTFAFERVPYRARLAHTSTLQRMAQL